MPLSLDACAVGNVTLIRCTGRIVAAADADALRRRVSALLPDCREVVLHLGNVAFVDSTGMGTLARLLTSARRCGGDLRLCNVGGEVLKVLQITRLNTLFQILQSEEDAVSSFSQGMPGRHAAARVRGRLNAVRLATGVSPDRSQQCASANVFVSRDERYTFGARRGPDESVRRIVGIVIGEL